MSEAVWIIIISNVITAVGAYFTARAQKQETPMQERSETFVWYRNLLEDTEKRYEKMEQDNVKLQNALANEAARYLKIEIEKNDKIRETREERDAYAAAFAKAARILEKNNLPVPALNGNDTPPRLDAVKK